jgi:hypothetical protein
MMVVKRLFSGSKFAVFHTQKTPGDEDNDGFENKLDDYPFNPDADNDGLLDGMDKDSDGYSNWFERNIAKTDPLIPNDRYAILVETYDPYEGRKQLEVDEMYDFLTGTLGWKEENIIKLLYEDGTFSNFQNAIDQIAAKADGNDLVYVALSGHGSPDYSAVFQPHVSYSTIDKELDKIKARALIVNISSCYSGGAIKYIKDGPYPRIVITSANDKEENGGLIGSLAWNLGGDLYLAATADGELKVPESLEFGGSRLGNQDSYVSLGEAFKLFEITCHGRPNNPDFPLLSPQIYDSDGIAPEIFLGEYKLVDTENIEELGNLYRY